MKLSMPKGILVKPAKFMFVLLFGKVEPETWKMIGKGAEKALEIGVRVGTNAVIDELERRKRND